MKRPRPLIGVNLLYVRPGYLGGTVRYAQQIIKHMVEQDRFAWRLYLQKEVSAALEPELAALPKTEFQVVGGLLGRVFTEHVILPFIAQRDHVDLLFSPGFVSPVWGGFSKVVTIPDLYYKRFPQFVRPWQRRYWQYAIPASIRAAEGVVTISDSTGADIAAAFPTARDKVRRIYPGADSLPEGERSAHSAQEKPFCLLVGNITPNKNIETVVAAFSILRNRKPDLRLVVAGSDLFGLLRSSISRHGQIEIEIREHVSDVMLAQLYTRAECLIQASHYEGFGLPVAEAMACGCPVVVSDIPVMREICKDAVLYFPTLSPAGLAETVLTCVADRELRERLMWSGKQQAENYTWKKAAEATVQLFGELI